MYDKLNNDQFRRPRGRPFGSAQLPGSSSAVSTAPRQEPTMSNAAAKVREYEDALRSLMEEPGSGADDAQRAPTAVTQLADRHLKEDGR